MAVGRYLAVALAVPVACGGAPRLGLQCPSQITVGIPTEIVADVGGEMDYGLSWVIDPAEPGERPVATFGKRPHPFNTATDEDEPVTVVAHAPGAFVLSVHGGYSGSMGGISTTTSVGCTIQARAP